MKEITSTVHPNILDHCNIDFFKKIFNEFGRTEEKPFKIATNLALKILKVISVEFCINLNYSHIKDNDIVLFHEFTSVIANYLISN